MNSTWREQPQGPFAAEVKWTSLWSSPPSSLNPHPLSNTPWILPPERREGFDFWACQDGSAVTRRCIWGVYGLCSSATSGQDQSHVFHVAHAGPSSPPGDDIPHTLWSIQKYVALSLALFSPKSDKERKGGSRDPFRLDTSQLGNFQQRKSYSSWERQYFYLVSFQHLIHN